MNRYIHQLIEDLNEATLSMQESQKFVCRNVEDEDEEEVVDIAYFEAMLNGTEEPMSKIVGIERILLPPIERLTIEQVNKLYPYIEDLLFAYNFDLDFPDGVPVNQKYALVWNIWEEKFIYMDDGFCTIDFCDYDCDFCPFGSELCRCKKLEEMG